MAADESAAPRHGRHSAAGRRPVTRAQAPQVADDVWTADASESPATVPFTPLGDAVADVAPLTNIDQELQMGDAPAPIGVDPSETGSFSRIDPSAGARVTTRVNASETASFRAQNSRPMEAVRMSTAGRPHVERRETEVKSNARVFAALGIAAVLVVGIVGWIVTRALLSVEEAPKKQVSEQTQALGEGGIEYRGTTYRFTKQKSGKYALVSSTEGQEGEAVVCELEGTPVTLILYNTVFVVPENLPDGTWDLIAHPLGGGGVTQQVTNGGGEPIIGHGEIKSALLVDDAIQVTTVSGDRTTISLV